MANDFYQIYDEQCTRLAETMVIKFDVSAVATNRYLAMVGIASSNDRRTWRYYMNMAGLYHSTNKMMVVRSADTGEMIEFTSENLDIHRATARDYQYGSKSYNDLLALHPKQESLILGILNPVNINVAINAPEGAILWIDPTLVEGQEDNLVELIQADITGMLERWHVEMYSIIDDLYDPARLTVLGANLVDMVWSARLRNERTHRAHSFFIGQYLARYGRLDKYMDAMTNEQKQFFYRNVVHFHKYPGHSDSFKWLTDKVMADRNLPLANHSLLQNESGMPDELAPKIEMQRHELTRQYAGVGDTRVTVDRVVDKQARLATLNRDTQDINISQAVDKMTLSKTNAVSTKVLESSVYDLKDSLPLKLEDMLISYWAYLSSKNQYLALTPFVDQRSGEATQLQPKDAFIVFLYCYNMAIGLPMPVVPVITANHIIKPRVPTTQQLFDLTSKKYFTIQTAKTVYDMIPPVGTIVSTENFYDTIYQVWEGALAQFNYASVRGHFLARGEIETMALYMFQDVGVDLADSPGQTMSQWLKDRSLEQLEDYTSYEHDAVWTDLLSRATGADLNTTLSLAYIHRAMVGVMERLSSYSVQFIREINDEPLKALANKWVWPGDSDGGGAGDSFLAMPVVSIIKSDGSAYGRRDVGLNVQTIIEREASAWGTSYTPMGLTWESSGESVRTSELIIPTVGIEPMPPREHEDLTGKVYRSNLLLMPLLPAGRPIEEVLLNRNLSGLNLPGLHGDDINETIRVKALSGINAPAEAPALSLEMAIPFKSLGGFVATTVDPNWIGNFLTVRTLSGLNLPATD